MNTAEFSNEIRVTGALRAPLLLSKKLSYLGIFKPKYQDTLKTKYKFFSHGKRDSFLLHATPVQKGSAQRPSGRASVWVSGCLALGAQENMTKPRRTGEGKETPTATHTKEFSPGRGNSLGE